MIRSYPIKCIVLFFIILCSCSTLQTEKVVIHQVKYRGETPFTIAKWYTNNGKNWYEIKHLNGQIHENKLLIGDTVRIPYRLITNFKEMPESFVNEQPRPKYNYKKASPSVSPAELEDNLLQNLIP